MITNLTFQESAELLQLVENLIPEYQNIDIQFTTEIPPEFSTDKEYPDFDGVLGLYIPDEELIKIYIQGIARVNRSSGISIRELLLIVLIHEIGHYYIHNVKLCNKETLWDTKSFKMVDTYMHEFLAQMFTYFCVESNENLKKSFETLAKQQSKPYRTFLDFKDLSKTIFDNLILYLRGLTEDPVIKKDVVCFIENLHGTKNFSLIPKFVALLNHEQKIEFNPLIIADKFGFFDD